LVALYYTTQKIIKSHLATISAAQTVERVHAFAKFLDTLRCEHQALVFVIRDLHFGFPLVGLINVGNGCLAVNMERESPALDRALSQINVV
jgi:hypothetical protein